MKYIGKVVGCMLLGLSLTANAGRDSMTIHSRANCINNETITWWWGYEFNWRVVSFHKHLTEKLQHQIDSGFNWTWRAHAIHWGEPFISGFWEVYGYHYEMEYSKYVPFGTTYADDCQIIEGW